VVWKTTLQTRVYLCNVMRSVGVDAGHLDVALVWCNFQQHAAVAEHHLGRDVLNEYRHVQNLVQGDKGRFDPRLCNSYIIFGLFGIKTGSDAGLRFVHREI
jgi:hypothetical protein